MKIAAAETQEELDEFEGKRMLKKFFGCEPKKGCELADDAAGWILLLLSLLVLCVCLALIVATLKSILKGRIAVWLHRTVNANIPDLKLGDVTIPLGWVTGYFAIGVGFALTTHRSAELPYVMADRYMAFAMLQVFFFLYG